MVGKIENKIPKNKKETAGQGVDPFPETYTYFAHHKAPPAVLCLRDKQWPSDGISGEAQGSLQAYLAFPPIKKEKKGGRKDEK